MIASHGLNIATIDALVKDANERRGLNLNGAVGMGQALKVQSPAKWKKTDVPARWELRAGASKKFVHYQKADETEVQLPGVYLYVGTQGYDVSQLVMPVLATAGVYDFLAHEIKPENYLGTVILPGYDKDYGEQGTEVESYLNEGSISAPEKGDAIDNETVDDSFKINVPSDEEGSEDFGWVELPFPSTVTDSLRVAILVYHTDETGQGLKKRTYKYKVVVFSEFNKGEAQRGFDLKVWEDNELFQDEDGNKPDAAISTTQALGALNGENEELRTLGYSQIQDAAKTYQTTTLEYSCTPLYRYNWEEDEEYLDFICNGFIGGYFPMGGGKNGIVVYTGNITAYVCSDEFELLKDGTGRYTIWEGQEPPSGLMAHLYANTVSDSYGNLYVTLATDTSSVCEYAAFQTGKGSPESVTCLTFMHRINTIGTTIQWVPTFYCVSLMDAIQNALAGGNPNVDTYVTNFDSNSIDYMSSAQGPSALEIYKFKDDQRTEFSNYGMDVIVRNYNANATRQVDYISTSAFAPASALDGVSGTPYFLEGRVTESENGGTFDVFLGNANRFLDHCTVAGQSVSGIDFDGRTLTPGGDGWAQLAATQGGSWSISGPVYYWLEATPYGVEGWNYALHLTSSKTIPTGKYVVREEGFAYVENENDQLLAYDLINFLPGSAPSKSGIYNVHCGDIHCNPFPETIDLFQVAYGLDGNWMVYNGNGDMGDAVRINDQLEASFDGHGITNNASMPYGYNGNSGWRSTTIPINYSICIVVYANTNVVVSPNNPKCHWGIYISPFDLSSTEKLIAYKFLAEDGVFQNGRANYIRQRTTGQQNFNVVMGDATWLEEGVQYGGKGRGQSIENVGAQHENLQLHNFNTTSANVELVIPWDDEGQDDSYDYLVKDHSEAPENPNELIYAKAKVDGSRLRALEDWVSGGGGGEGVADKIQEIYDDIYNTWQLSSAYGEQTASAWGNDHYWIKGGNASDNWGVSIGYGEESYDGTRILLGGDPPTLVGDWKVQHELFVGNRLTLENDAIGVEDEELTLQTLGLNEQEFRLMATDTTQFNTALANLNNTAQDAADAAAAAQGTANAASAQAATNAQAINGLGGRMNAAEGSITTLTNVLSATSGDVVTLQTTVGNHTSQIGQLTTDLGTVTGDVSTLQTTVGTQGSSITLLQNEYISVTGDIYDISGDVTTINETVQNIVNGTSALPYVHLSGDYTTGYITRQSIKMWLCENGETMNPTSNNPNGSVFILFGIVVATYGQAATTDFGTPQIQLFFSTDPSLVPTPIDLTALQWKTFGNRPGWYLDLSTGYELGFSVENGNLFYLSVFDSTGVEMWRSEHAVNNSPSVWQEEWYYNDYSYLPTLREVENQIDMKVGDIGSIIDYINGQVV